jgi:hypothetical protein
MSFVRNSGDPEGNRPLFQAGWAEELKNNLSIDIFRKSDKTILARKRANKEDNEN